MSLHAPHERRPGRGVVAGVQLSFELVKKREAVPGSLVAERVDEASKAVDRPEVWPRVAGGEERDDREVLARGPSVDRFDTQLRRVEARRSHGAERTTHALLEDGRVRSRDAPDRPAEHRGAASKHLGFRVDNDEED